MYDHLITKDNLTDVVTKIQQLRESDASAAGQLALTYFDGVVYDSINKRINFKHGNTILTYVDATDFIRDGMIEDVKIITPSSGTNSGKPCLFIDFNTDSVITDIEIPLENIFNPSDYYTKTAIDNKFVEKISGKGLSTEDYTTSEKTKLAGIASGAEVNVQSDWNQTTTTADDYIKNKPESLKNPNAITIQKNSTTIDTYDGSVAKTINIVVPTKTSDITNDSNFPVDANYVHTDNNYTTAEKQQLADVAGRVSTIEGKIPNAATNSNQLADKNFVNSSIATSTASFRGTSVSGLTEEQFTTWANSLTHDLNDYVYWVTVDAAGNTLFKRYKYDGTNWVYEYTLNNSSFTSDEWTAIQSGATPELIQKLNALPSNDSLTQSLGSKVASVKVGNTSYSPTNGVVSLPAYPTTLDQITDGTNRKLISMTEITWSNLKSLRNNSQLIPGMQYRITDYNTTTAQENTQSANHQFDIIVVADSVNKLNENARACLHSGDTYFSSCKIEAWELKYCIDNDTTKFAWADSINGKGVIYWMKDEWNNECPYDFKNIQFARWEQTNPIGYLRTNGTYNIDSDQSWVNNFNHRNGYYSTNGSTTKIEIGYQYEDGGKYIIYTVASSPVYCFTFSKGVDITLNINSGYKCVYGNVIKEYWLDKLTLNNIVFLNTNASSDYCYMNKFSYSCRSMTFGNSCYINEFGRNCYSNTFKSLCSDNSFGNSCTDNVFGERVSNNIFGQSCSDNILCYNCKINTLTYQCHYNILGRYCESNFYGSFCSFNIFGDSCFHNILEGSNSYIIFGNSSTTKSYYKYITIEKGNQYIRLYCSATTSSSNYYQNIKIAKGVNNITTYKDITDLNVNQAFQTVYQPQNSQIISV